MDMELFAKDVSDNEFKKIAVANWYNEDAKEEMASEAGSDLSN
jgi:hypothetical protein